MTNQQTNTNATNGETRMDRHRSRIKPLKIVKNIVMGFVDALEEAADEINHEGVNNANLSNINAQNTQYIINNTINNG
ncbi:hypothetical protein bcgnr5390_61550 [Bacillus luti]|nr:hypothetical protein BC2903_31280 [Bacillus cereus]